MSETRCADCLAEFRTGARFAVIKEDTSRAYSDEMHQLSAHLYMATVCQDCVGWYQGDHMEISGEDAMEPFA